MSRICVTRTLHPHLGHIPPCSHWHLQACPLMTTVCLNTFPAGDEDSETPSQGLRPAQSPLFQTCCCVVSSRAFQTAGHISHPPKNGLKHRYLSPALEIPTGCSRGGQIICISNPLPGDGDGLPSCVMGTKSHTLIWGSEKEPPPTPGTTPPSQLYSHSVPLPEEGAS